MTGRPMLVSPVQGVPAPMPNGAEPRGESTPRLGFLKARIMEAATVAALETAVNDFLKGFGLALNGTERFVDIQYMALDATHYSALILYTE